MNKKLKFPPLLVSAIQEGRRALCSSSRSRVETTGGGPGGPLRNVEEAADCSWREALNLAMRVGH